MKELKEAHKGMIAILTVMLVSITRRLPMRKLSSGITTTLALAGIVLLVAAGSASALPCPAPGNADISASCELTQDYTVATAGQYGYKIMADGVVIDGKGYTLTGTMPASCGGGEAAPCACAGVINYDFDNAVVKDLEITGFCTGVVMGDNNDADDVVNMTVTGCKIHNCGEPTGTTHGIHLVRANDCTISKNEIYEIDGTGIAAGCGGGGNGIFGYGADQSHGNYGSVTCNYLHDNTKSGVFTKKMCQYWTFSNNNASANLQGGIVPMCKKSSFCTIEYNIMTGNGAFGYQSQANQNTLRFNTITNNGQFGIIFKSDKWASPAYGMNNEAYNNTICGHTVADIRQAADDGGTNKADSNTCDTTQGDGGGTAPAGACDWSCDTKVPIYYDYDGDVHYSAASCSCGNILGVGACCNPGLFNDTGASTHCGGGVCVLSAGDDPNDCDPGAPAEQPYYCDVDEDGYFSAAPTGTGAEVPPDCQPEPGDDCNDANPDVNPGAAENCTDGIDNDCDGLVDGEDPDCFPNKVYFEPSDIRVPEYGDNKTVGVWINSTAALASGTIIFDYASCCANVTDFEVNMTNFDPLVSGTTFVTTLMLGKVKMDFATGELAGFPANVPVHLGDMTIECNASDYSYCVTNLAWNTTDTEVNLMDAGDVEITPVNYEDGTFMCNIPDLVVTMVKGTEINPGNYTVECTVKNVGDVNASESYVSLEIDNNGVVAATMFVNRTLEPGDTFTGTFALVIEQSGSVDNLTVCADYNNTVVETDETNNCMIGRYPGEVVISIQPPETFVQPQDQFDVKVYIDTKGINVYAVQYRLTYNTSVVRAETQVKGPFLGPISDTMVVINNIDQPHGVVSYAETRKVSGEVNDNDNVTNIHFIAIGERGAITNLTLDEIILSDEEGNRIAYVTEDGTVEITANTPPVPVGVTKHRVNNVAQKYQSTAILCSCSYDLDYPGKGGNITYIRWAFGDGQYGTSEGLPDENNCTCKEHKYESWQWQPFGVPYDPENPEDGGNYVPFEVQLDVMDDGCPELTNSTNFTIDVYIAGDANGDGEVNVLDAVWVGKNWGGECTCNPYPYDYPTSLPDYCGCGDCEGNYWNDDQAEADMDAADLNNDCEINVLDAVIIGANWRHTAW